MFESAIGAYIVNGTVAGRYKTYYWRDAKGKEVDYVLEKNGQLLAIEVKSNADDSNSGLGEFRKQFPNTKAIIVGDGGLKAEDFLQMKPEALF